MSINWKIVGAIGATLALATSTTALSMHEYKKAQEKKTELAKLVIEHPEEYKIYQDMERFKKLESDLSRAKTDTERYRESLSCLNDRYDALNKKYLKICEKLKVFLENEMRDLVGCVMSENNEEVNESDEN